MRSLLLLVVLLAPASVSARSIVIDFEADPPPVVEVLPEDDQIRARIVGLTRDLWVRRHESASAEKPLVFYQYGDLFLYAASGDLFEIDIRTGEVESRKQYPAPISSIEDDEDGRPIVVLDTKPPLKVAITEVVPKFRGAWSDFPFVALRPVRDVPESVRRLEPHVTDTEVLQLAKSAPDNPFFRAYLGLRFHKDGKTEQADLAFVDALRIARDAPFSDQFHLCGVLARGERLDLAKEACEAGRESLLKTGTRPEGLYSLILFVVLNGELAKAMDAAIVAKDIERADEIAELMYAAFPRVEASFVAWRSFANWLKENGEPTLALKWASRAKEIEHSDINVAFWGSTRAVDLWLLWLVVFLLALPFAGFACGLRGARKAERPTEGWRRHVPTPSILEVVFALGLVLLSVYGSYKAAAHVTTIGSLASAPIAVLQDGYGSPDIVEWLDYSLPESDAQRTLIAFSKKSTDAFALNVDPPDDPPPVSTLVDAVEELSHIKSRDKLFEVRTDFGPESVPNALPFGVPMLFLFFVFSILGFTIGRNRKTNLIAGYVALGGHASFLAGPIVALFLGGVLYLFTPLGHILTDIATPSFDRYFGMQSAGGSEQVAYEMWPFLAIGIALIAHTASCFVEKVRARG